MKIGKYITLKHEITAESNDSVNDISVKKVETLKPFESVIVSENKRVCEIKGYRNKHTLDVNLKFDNEECVIKFFYPNNTVTEVVDLAGSIINAVKNKNITNAIKDISYPKVYDANDNLIGTMDYHFVDVNDVRQNYSGFKFNYNEKVFTIYKTPSHYSEKPAWCIYENDEKLVAEIIVDRHKFMSPYSDLLKYDIYVEEDVYFNVACILTTIWVNIEGGEYYNEKTSLKYLKQRYSSDFIEKIRNGVNPIYLPENMSLAKELYNTAKFDIRRIAPKIIGGIIVLALIIYMIISAVNS